MCWSWSSGQSCGVFNFIEHVPIRELARRKGLQRATVRRAIRSTDPPKKKS